MSALARKTAKKKPTATPKTRRGYTQSHVDRIVFWKTHPFEWFCDLFGENVYKLQQNRGSITADGMWKETGKPADLSGLTGQQIDALVDWGKLIEAKLLAAAGKPHNKGLADKIGMSIQSANGTGKDFEACIITWHFMFCFSYPKIIATANTGKQLNEVYWSELAKVRGLARATTPDGQNDLQTNFTMQSEMLFANLPNKEERGKRWFCTPVTINVKGTAEQQGEALAGRHEDFMLFVLDEASNLAPAVFKPIEKTLTGKLNLMFQIFNPTQTTGYAIESQTTQSAKWVCKHWTGIDSENVTRASIRNLAAYGKESPDYRIGVLGLPPLTDASSLIPYPWIQAALNREFDCSEDPIMAGADVGGGGDKSVFCWRQGGMILGFKTFNSKKTDEVADWVAECVDEVAAAVVFIDTIGIGKGVYDNLRRMGYKARPACATNTADEEERYVNMRADRYWLVRKQFEEGLISIPEPQNARDAQDPIVRFMREAGAIKSKTVGDKQQIEDKKTIKQQIGFSPDFMDACVYTYWKPDSLFRKVKTGKERGKVSFKGVYLR
jgi:phage terminase large subunit